MHAYKYICVRAGMRACVCILCVYVACILRVYIAYVFLLYYNNYYYIDHLLRKTTFV